jgi:hypothetical protein
MKAVSQQDFYDPVIPNAREARVRNLLLFA